MLWETNITARPDARRSFIRERHFAWNSMSPTARTSSTRRISAGTVEATANPRRTCMPEE